jgi:ABC-type spermidine/putrescine transport system permease subunit II
MSTTANVSANAPSAWDTPIIIIGAVSAVVAVMIGLPGAIIAVRDLRRNSNARKGINLYVVQKSIVDTRLTDNFD